MENNSLLNAGSEDQQSQSKPLDDKPGLSQIRKSWGFRRSTIAQREFVDEVGEQTSSPLLVRRARSRHSTQTPPALKDNKVAQARQASLAVINDLEWSAPASPVSEEPKPALSHVGGCLDPSMWQDIGSAFGTAFSLLGGDEGLSMDISDDLAIPEVLPVSDATEPILLVADNTEVSEYRELAHNVGILQPVPLEKVASGNVEDVVLISSQDEDSDEVTLIQIKEQLQSKSMHKLIDGRGGRGKARGRGRGRGRGKGRGRGRGKALEVQSLVEDDDVMLVNPSEEQLQHLQEGHKENDSHTLISMETSPAHSVKTLSPVQQMSSDFIIIDTDVEQNTDTTSGPYDDTPEEGKRQDHNDREVIQHSRILASNIYDPTAVYCICRQKHNKRFMISCDSCQECFHGDCVGVSETDGRTEYLCPPCTSKKLSQPPSDSHTQPEPKKCPVVLSLIPSGDKQYRQEELDSLKKTVQVEGNDIEVASVNVPEPAPGTEVEMETDSSLPLCIGQGCSRPALLDSVYCGADCIIQHATFTMKSISDTKEPKPRGRAQRNATTTTPTAKGQCSRVSPRLAAKAEENANEEELMEGDGTQTACDSNLTEVQATSLPSSKLYTALTKGCKQIETQSPPKQNPEDPTTDASPSQQPTIEQGLPQSDSNATTKDSIKSDVLVETEKSVPLIMPNEKLGLAPPTSSPNTPGSKKYEKGGVLNSTTYIIPKKQSGLKPLSSSQMATPSLKPMAPTLLNESRNLPVPPAPSAPSSRPSQPNNQVRQSIQRSLTSILLKRVCDCEDLEMCESDAAKLVASIETEMFDIFRNTDSKYMNKYRTIMFNLKDPRHKGLLYRVVQGDISPFRLVRMSQKDMQATKAPDQNVKDTSEVKNAAAQGPSFLQKPEVAKVDLFCLNITKPDRRPKRSISTPTLTPKNRRTEQSRENAVPDVLTCMLKDTTSEHKAHLFDLKCKICTGQIPPFREEEPPNKKKRLSESSDKHYSRRRKEDDSPLRAPPDSPDMDFSTDCPYDPSSRLIIDTGDLTIVESPVSTVMDSPASPTLESPASPVLESPTSPTDDTSKTTIPKRAYTPVVIPAVSTVTITRRDPRTAANRSSAAFSGTTNTSHNQSAPYAPRGASSAPSSVPTLTVQPTKLIPKPILMKPPSSADPRFYDTSSRTVISESPVDGATAQFLAKQEILWKGFLNMLTVSKFATKGYLVSGSAEILKSELPDTIEIGGRIMPQTVWDYVAKLKTSLTKDLCVIRFHPATEEEEVAYVSLFSYFSSRGRFGVVSNNSRSIKDVYLLPLSAKESIPSILQPLEGPGLEKVRPNLLLGLAVIQKTKRPGSVLQEIEQKKTRVHLSKDPMWIPKPPVLYGSDKLELSQPHVLQTPASTSPPLTPSYPGSPSDSSSNSDNMPLLLASIKSTPAVSTSAPAASTPSTSNNDKNLKFPSDDTPLKTILSTLFQNKPTSIMVSNGKNSATNTTTVSATKGSVLSRVSGSTVDPIVQQYGQKAKVKAIEEEENAFDRPYDPEEEYDPAIGYGTFSSQTPENKLEDLKFSGFNDDYDVAYDPEDETIFQDLPSDAKKCSDQSQMLNCPSSLVISAQAKTPTCTTSSPKASSVTEVLQTIPTGTVVVSAATLTEQQRMLEELNKQIEEQKQQLKEQEEALRQQKEAVGMFMAQFSVSDSMMSASSKSLPLSQVSSLQSSVIHSESKPFEERDSKPEIASNLTNYVDDPNSDSPSDKQENTNVNPCLNIPSVTVQDDVSGNIKDNDKYSSAGEIEDSDVPYDPEDDLFNEIQDDVFQGSTTNIQDSCSSTTGHRGTSPNSYHSRRHRLSPKRRSHRERDSHRSPSSRSQQRSTSHSRKHRERNRHRKSERDRSKHRSKDHSERQGRHHKVHSTRRHSHDRKRSPSSSSKRDLVSHAHEFRAASPNNSEQHQLKSNVDGVNNPNQKSADKDLSQKNVDLKPETSQQPVSVHNNSHIQQGTGGNKLEIPIPLRVIDPPIRDSPESPDPDPRFVAPTSIRDNHPAESEDIIDSVTQISDPLEKVKNDCQIYGSEEMLVNMPLSIEDMKSNVGMDLSTTDVQGSDSGEQDMSGKCLELKHSEMKKIAHAVITDVPELGIELTCLDRGPEHHTSHHKIKIEGNLSESEYTGEKPHVTGQPQMTGKVIEPNNQSCNFPKMRDFQPLRRDVGLNRGYCNQENSVKSNLSTGSENNFLTASPAVSDDKQHIKQDDACVRGPGPNIKYENSDTFCIGQDTIGSANSQEAQFNIKCERGIHDLDMKVSQKQLEQRRHNTSEACSLGPGQSVACLSGQGFSDAVNSNAVSSGRGFEETCPDHSQVSIQGINNQDLCQPDSWTRGGQNTELVECMSDQNQSCPTLVRDYNHLSNSRGTSSVRVGQLPQVEVHQPGWTGASMEIHGHDRSFAQGVDPCNPWAVGGPNVRPSKNDRRRLSDPEAMGPLWEKIQVQDRRGHGSPEFMKTDPLSQGPTLEGIRQDRRGPIVSDFMGSETDVRGPNMYNWHGAGAERVCTDMRVPVHVRRIPDVHERTQEVGNSTLAGSISGRESVGPGFRGPKPENKNPAINIVGHGIRVPLIPDHLGPCFERGPGMAGPLHVRRQAEEGPLNRGPAPDWKDLPTKGTKHDMRGPIVPDFSEPWNARRGPGRGMLHCNRKGPGGHDVREQGPVVKRSSMECRRIDPNGGPNFSEPGNERRDMPVNSPKFDRERLGYPDFRGMQPDRRESFLSEPRSDRLRGHINVKESRFEMKAVEGQEPLHLIRRGDKNTDVFGTGAYASGPEHDLIENSFERLSNRQAWDPQSESRNPNMEETRPYRRGSDSRGPVHEINFPVPDNQGHGLFTEQGMMEPRISNMNRPGHQISGPNTECSGPFSRQPERQETRFCSRGPGPFGQLHPNKKLPEIMYPESNRRSSHFRAGLESERKIPSSQDFRRPTCQSKNTNNPLGLESQEPEEPDFRNQNFEKGPEDPGRNWRSESPQCREPEISQNNCRSGSDKREDQRHGKKCDFSVTGFRGPESGINCHGSRWKETEGGYSDSEMHFEDKWKHHNNQYPHPIPKAIDAPVLEYPVDPDVQIGPNISGFELMPERENLPFSGPRRVLEDDWRGPDCRGPGSFQDDRLRPRPRGVGPRNECRRPGRGRSEPRWRPEHIDFRERGHKRRGPGMKVPGIDKRGVHKALRQSDNSRGSHTEGTKPVQRSSNLNNSFPNRREFEMHDNNPVRREIGDLDVRFCGPENPNLGRPLRDLRSTEPRAVEPERQGLDIEISGPRRQGFEPGYRMQGPDIKLIHSKNDIWGPPGDLKLGLGPGEWVADTEVPVCNRKEEDERGPELDSRQRNHAMKDDMQCSDIRDSGRYNRSSFNMRGRGSKHSGRSPCGSQSGYQGSDVKSFVSSVNPKSEEVKTLKPRTGLLPTPTEGRVSAPNRIMNNMQQKQISPHVNK
ncbi:uncharacterized protein [Nerophis lumbriciformis]|uniref:uncharacterized protein isoform X3 n=1 Tax=Nerophis lumbriciformis TaxID=546530 RepID=UPI002ADF124D|nr:uncharacterized protein LOC133618744 isoform X3 [Nerophis lumbriciformis]